MNQNTARVGDILPTLETGSVTRHHVALYAHGSGDLNPIHVDADYAREHAGLPDVIVHGMYSMGMLSRLVNDWAGPNSVLSIDVRFEAMMPVKDSLTCKGVVSHIRPVPGGSIISVSLTATKSDGAQIASGSADVFAAARPAP